MSPSSARPAPRWPPPSRRPSRGTGPGRARHDSQNRGGTRHANSTDHPDRSTGGDQCRRAAPGPGEIEGVVELRPALLTKEFHEALAGLVADGKTTPRGAPKNPLQLGATFWHFRHESRISSPPIAVQNLMLPPLWALAKLFGIRPYYDHWNSQT